MPVAYLKQTPSQTAGPYLHIGMAPAVAGLPGFANEPSHRVHGDGERIIVDGLVFDGVGTPLRDAVIELWQADAHGRYGVDGFRGWARSATDVDTGLWRFDTIRPGPIRASDGGLRAPFLDLLVFARGINMHLHTRLYFPEDGDAHRNDPTFLRIEQPQRRRSLIATSLGDAHYRFDIRLQGPDETVFFDV